MRVQWELLLGLFIINLSIGVIMNPALGFAGTGQIQTPTYIDAGEYEEHFNGTQIADSWDYSLFSGIPVVGDIYSGLSYFVQNLGYLIDGLPMFLNWIKEGYIHDSTAQLAFDVVAGAIRALYALLIAMLIIEFISGRYLTD